MSVNDEDVALRDELNRLELLGVVLQRVGFAFWQLCELEDSIANARVLRLQATRGMGRDAGDALLAKARQRTFGQNLRPVLKANIFESALAERLSAILEERNWLAHHAKRENRGVVHSESRLATLIARLDAIGDEATALNSDVGRVLSEWVRAQEVPEQDIEFRVREILREWGYPPTESPETPPPHSGA